jgi:hypothetical protein
LSSVRRRAGPALRAEVGFGLAPSADHQALAFDEQPVRIFELFSFGKDAFPSLIA